MDRNVEKLQDEIEFLKRRVSTLEKKENRRTSAKYLKILWKIVLYSLIAFGLWKGYDYVVHGIPNMLEEKIQELNPFKKD